MTTVEAFAPAKINLTLHVTGRRADGFHELDSLVVFGGDADRVSVSPAEDLTLRVTGPMAAGVPADQSNLVLRAARALSYLRGVPATGQIHLEKHLPNGAGIGGGSADAAATLRLLARLWKVDPMTADEAIAIGGDVPVCLQAPAPAFLRGIGERVSPAPRLPSLFLVLANPGIAVNTGLVFQRFGATPDHRSDPMDDLPGTGDAGLFLTWLSRQRNDLETPATGLFPAIQDVLDALARQPGCALSRMSGSGSTCWGIFDDQDRATAAERALSQRYPGWWVRRAEMGGAS